MKLKIFCHWKPKSEIKKTWSGSAYSMFKEFQKDYSCEIVDRNTNLFCRNIWKYSQKYHSLFLEKLFCRIQDYLLQRKLRDSDTVFMISAVLKVKNPTYVFFDNIWATEDVLIPLDEDINGDWSFREVFQSYSKKQKEFNINRQYQIMEHSKAIFCMGHWLSDFIKLKYPEFSSKTYIVGGGINISNSSNKNRIPNSILFVGKDFYRKGGDLVVKAYRILKEKNKGLKLTIAGPTVMPKEITDDIDFLGEISFEKVDELMSTHSIFCMPSRFEAYGLVFVEALVNGIPCIGRNAWEMPYFIEEGVTGELIGHDDAEELASKMERVLNSHHYCQNVQARHDYYVQEYSWKNVCKRISDNMKR